MKSLNSVTTINQRAHNSPTSARHTEFGVAILNSSDKEQAVQRLIQANNPMEVTRKVTDSVRTLVPSLKERHGHDFTLLGFTITKFKTENVMKAIRLVNISMASLPPSRQIVGQPDKDGIEQRIAAMLPLLTLPKDFDPQILSLKSQSLSVELTKYPADIVIHAFEEVKKRATFYPSFAEFYKHIEARYLHRKYLLDALHKCIAYKVN